MFKLTLPTTTKSTIDLSLISRSCPSCHTKAHIHQKRLRSIKDPRLTTVEQIRLLCPKCKHSWNINPDGVRNNSGRTTHTLLTGILLYAMGISYGNVPTVVLFICGEKLTSKSSSWRDLMRTGLGIRLRQIFSNGRTPKVLGGDGTYVKIRGEKACITFCNDTADSSTISISLTDERDEQALKKLFTDMAKEMNLTQLYGLITDDNPTFSALVDDLNGLNPEGNKLSYYRIKHGLCLAHAKKNIIKQIKEISSSKHPPLLQHQQYLDKLQQIIEADFPLGEEEELGRIVIQNDVARSEVGQLLKRVYLKYHKYSLHRELPEIPATNNLSERKFILPKVRYKSMRGFKSKEGCLNFLHLMVAGCQGQLNDEITLAI